MTFLEVDLSQKQMSYIKIFEESIMKQGRIVTKT